MACDTTHGHTTFVMVKLDINTHLSFVNRNTIVAGSWNANRTEWTLNAFSTDIRCTYTWPRGSGEMYEMTWRLYSNDKSRTVFTKTGNIYMVNATDYYNLFMDNGSQRFTLAELIEMDYIVTLSLYGKLTDSPQERLFATIRYNVQTEQITY